MKIEGKVMTRLSKIVFALAVVALVPTTVAAKSGTIRGPYVGCVTDSLLDEFVGAAGEKDYQQMNALLNRICFNIEGRRYSTVDVGFFTSEIRIYTEGGSVVLFTVNEALR